MKCLLCGKVIGQNSLKEMLFHDDVICEKCRNSFEKNTEDEQFQGYTLHADYVYNEAFSSVLIQYKELLDEALKDVFLYHNRKKIKRMYKGYTLLLLPSTQKAYERRGFSHLEKMVECLDLPYMQPFVKLDNVKQKTLNLDQRKMITHRIALKEGVKLPKNIVLFDDVVTSGSTISGVLNAIDAKNHNICIHVVAKVPIER